MFKLENEVITYNDKVLLVKIGIHTWSMNNIDKSIPVAAATLAFNYWYRFDILNGSRAVRDMNKMVAGGDNHKLVGVIVKPSGEELRCGELENYPVYLGESLGGFAIITGRFMDDYIVSVMYDPLCSSLLLIGENSDVLGRLPLL